MADIQSLTDEEINNFVADLDKDGNGCISYEEIEHKLDEIHKELAPEAKSYNLNHDSKEKQRHQFLRQMLATDESSIPADEFKKVVKSWNVPSLEQDKKAAQDEDDYLKNISFQRRLRAGWEIHGPTYVFLGVVVGWQIGLGIWQCYKYAAGPQYQAAFGWGVGVAKAAAGALYPTLFFLVLSMSRWFSTFMRRWYYVSRFINWDLSQSFHVKMSIVALFLASLHAIGHLSGTFNWGSRANRQEAVGALLGPDAVPRPYVAYIRALPGWTGLTALGLFYVIALLSMPYVRKRSYEIFQIGHLLMFPMLGLLMAHGSLGLLQYPMLGIVLAFPTLLVFLERSMRIISGFHKIPAKLEILDDETVKIIATIPNIRLWPFKAGQYVFLSVPQISHFQQHPFTVSTCIGKELTLHIKTDGDWTGKLRDLTDLKYVGIDGPYGAPAQRFYDFDQAMIVGAGIGVTPFSGILNDLQTREDHKWVQRRDSTSSHESETTVAADTNNIINNEKKGDNNEKSKHKKPTDLDLNLYRRVDFHWIVRDRNYLRWFSDLLNRVSSGEHSPNLDIRIYSHVTKKRKDISQHVYRYILEKHRTPENPYSPITGLIAPTHFGRPDFPTIMDKHYQEMQELFAKDRKRKRKVGVFFCGAPIIGKQLADECHQLTLRGREDKSEVEYHFQIEVFG